MRHSCRNMAAVFLGSDLTSLQLSSSQSGRRETSAGSTTRFPAGSHCTQNGLQPGLLHAAQVCNFFLISRHIQKNNLLKSGPHFQDLVFFKTNCIQFRRKLCQNSPAQMAVLLVLGHWAMGYVIEQWNMSRPATHCGDETIL